MIKCVKIGLIMSIENNPRIAQEHLDVAQMQQKEFVCVATAIIILKTALDSEDNDVSAQASPAIVEIVSKYKRGDVLIGKNNYLINDDPANSEKRWLYLIEDDEVIIFAGSEDKGAKQVSLAEKKHYATLLNDLSLDFENLKDLSPYKTLEEALNYHS